MAAVAEPAAGTVTGRGARPVLGPEVWIPLVLLSGALGRSLKDGDAITD